MCICGISMILQMAVMNCYHIYPLRQIPGWLKRVQTCMSCVIGSPCRSNKNDVSSNNSDIGHANKPAHKFGEQSLHITQIEDNEVKGDSSTLEKNTREATNAMSNKFRTDEEDENLRQEWMELARNVDRVLLFTFTTIHIFMILLVFVIMPNTWNNVSFHWK